MEKNKFINDKREGYWEQSFFNGGMYAKGNYINGIKIGYWEFYDFFNDAEILYKEFYLY
jgi:hypothetical protein